MTDYSLQQQIESINCSKLFFHFLCPLARTLLPSTVVSPGCSQERRGSLPPLDIRSELPCHLQAARSKRRLSCVAAIALSPAADESEQPSNAFSRTENKTLDRRHQLIAIKTEAKENRSALSADESREKQTDALVSKVQSKLGKRNGNGCREIDSAVVVGGRDTGGNGDSPNINPGSSDTVVWLHQGQVRPSGQDISDEELQSIFADARRNCRRSSEPVLGHCLVRGLQDLSLEEMSSFIHPRGADSEELRKSIQRNLPSDIVAETDEEEMETKDTDTSENLGDLTSPPANSRVRTKLSSISESDQDDYRSESSPTFDQNKSGISWEDGQETSPPTRNIGGKMNLKSLQERRKSDGDVLTLYSAHRSGSKTSDLSVSTASKDKESDSQETPQSVKECPNSRSQDLQEMNESAEVRKFVFGDRNKD